MAELKLKPTRASVNAFIEGLADEQARKDSYTLTAIMQKATKQPPKMWGSSIIGFGDFHYVYDTGREGDVGIIGFAPRKNQLTLYTMSSGWHNMPSIEGLGKFTLGKSCLYIKRLDDVSVPQLRKLVGEVVKDSKRLQKEMTKKKEEQVRAKAANQTAGAAKRSSRTKKARAGR